ncbi:hypothetical protein Q3G72_012058 [Acer saccharum]|nr:hypothetical protein Q3G72_012058 [Acer saccharum]
MHVRLDKTYRAKLLESLRGTQARFTSTTIPCKVTRDKSMVHSAIHLDNNTRKTLSKKEMVSRVMVQDHVTQE